MSSDEHTKHGPADEPHFEPGRGWVRSCLCGREFVSRTGWQHVPAFWDHLATMPPATHVYEPVEGTNLIAMDVGTHRATHEGRAPHRSITHEPTEVDLGCPTCGAPPGQFCHTPTGKPRSDHAKREYEKPSNDDR